MFGRFLRSTSSVSSICFDMLRGVTCRGGHYGVTSVYNSSASGRHGVDQSDLAHLLSGSASNAALFRRERELRCGRATTAVSQREQSTEVTTLCVANLVSPLLIPVFVGADEAQ